MGWLIDTNVAIYLRDDNRSMIDRIEALPTLPKLSIVSQVELEGGVYARPELALARRQSLDVILRQLTVIDFDASAVVAYRHIVAQCGYSRRLILDRMIAATAIAHSLKLITLNPTDFCDISDLRLDAW